MHLGIDLGTTRTIVATSDRGNYPVVGFTDADDDPQQHIPSVAADAGDGIVYGLDAVAAAADGAPLVGSFKRLLAAPDVTPDTVVRVGRHETGILDLLTGFLTHVHEMLAQRSSVAGLLPAGADGVPAVVAVPAHALSAQRFLTLEAFRAAGFDVRAMLNEPSAAGLEYTHVKGSTITSRRTRVLVYDLGGGTFDASLVRVEDRAHEVAGSLGLNALGGDDFDAVLEELALREAGLAAADVGARDLADLRRQVRDAKEHLSPQSRRIPLDVGDVPVSVPVPAFYEAAAPLVERTLDAMSPLLDGPADGSVPLEELAGIYLVGGATGLPLVPRMLKERFGRRVHRSLHPAASTAIGLAIAGDEGNGYTLVDRFSRGFGVFREAEGGRRVSFDALVPPELVVDGEGTEVVRRYRAAHNLGHYRYVEYTRTDADGVPVGDVMPFGRIVFPFDRSLQGREDLSAFTTVRGGEGDLIEERYAVDAHGIVTVALTDLDTGHSVARALGRTD